MDYSNLPTCRNCDDKTYIKTPMIKKALLVYFILLALSLNAFAEKPNFNDYGNHSRQDTIKKVGPQIVFKINTHNSYVDRNLLTRIDTTWIKKIGVLKDKKYKNLYDPPAEEAVILVHFKKKYIKQVKDLINNNK